MSKFMISLLILLNYGEQSLATTLRGAIATTGQFPWLIQFQTIIPCGGILVSPEWVLTAAQCVQFKRNSITLYATGLNGTGSRQTLGIKAAYIFPQYKAYSTIHDHEHNIALLKLIKPFDMCDDKVQLLDLAPVRPDDDYKTCLIFGWQSYVAPSTKVLAKPIQYSHVLLNPWDLCTYMLKGNTSYNNVFCAMRESEEGLKACAGNPGSPIVCKDRYQRMILLGIASWSNFSLECGMIPTYLGISVFRSWMYDLIFNDRNIEGWDDAGKFISPGICGYDRYLGSIASRTRALNYTDFFESQHQRVNDNKNPVNRVWKPLEVQTSNSSRMRATLSKVENLYHINDYSEVSSNYGVPSDIVREREDSLKQYREVGQNKEASAIIEDIVIAFPTRKEKSSYLGQPNEEENSDNNVKKAGRLDLKDVLEDSDFSGPLDEDYFIGSSSSSHLYSREQSLFSVIFLAYFSIVL